MKNNKSKRIASYIVMPLLFIILGFIVLFISGKPVAAMIEAYGNMIITKGAPGYGNEYDPELSKLVMNKKSTFHTNQIQVPALETHYANLYCERVELDAPVYYGDSDTVLSYGVGQYAASGLPGEGKPILIGGHDATYFAPLEHINIGDIVTIETNYGQFEYKVAATRIADALETDSYDLSQAKEQLILYTCYPFNQLLGDSSDRFFVYCDRILDSETVSE